MFEILRKSLATGIVTKPFPSGPDSPASGFGRGRPQIDFPKWKDARPASEACPTGALACTESHDHRTVVLDLGKCTFCGLCAEADTSITMTRMCELPATRRDDLLSTAVYE